MKLVLNDSHLLTELTLDMKIVCLREMACVANLLGMVSVPQYKFMVEIVSSLEIIWVRKP